MKPLAVFLLACGVMAGQTFTNATLTNATTQQAWLRMQTILPNGGRLSFSEATGKIYYDYMESNGWFDIHAINLDGTGDVCLTCGKTNMGKHVGNPAVDPAGEHLVFQALKEGASGAYDGQGPGAGALHDVYICTLPDCDDITKVRNVSATESADSAGVLHPHFNHAGNQLTWSERYEAGGAFGHWRIMLATVSYPAGVPTLSSVTTEYDPVAFTETHGFSHDDSLILYTGNEDAIGLQIYTRNIVTNAVVRLTTDSNWNEHAHYSPNGEKIIWACGPYDVSPFDLNTELCIMDANGSNKQTLTTTHTAGQPYYFPDNAAADAEWLPNCNILLFNVTSGGDSGGGTGFTVQVWPLQAVREAACN